MRRLTPPRLFSGSRLFPGLRLSFGLDPSPGLRLSALLVGGGLAALPAAAQLPTAPVRQASAQVPGGTAGAARVADARPQRPAADPLSLSPVTPQLQAVLENWHARTSQVKKLEGEHRRWKYELTFGVEKRSQGHFYYEAPDRGRIDIESIDPAKDKAPPGTHPETGQPFQIQADQPQQWICDGQRIVQINPADKTYEANPVPPQLRGANIMDGPLPFLFGMPPEKARQRYDITLTAETADRVTLAVRPRWAEDAANYKEANVILSKPAYLPAAVQMLDPSGNGRTVYTFGKLQVNSGGGVLALFGADPFRPNLIGYSAVQTSPAGAALPAGVPSAVGLEWRQAKTVLEARGYLVKIVPGPAAPQDALTYCVMDQTPAPRAPLDPGGLITLTVYNKPQTAQK